jgi:outer membrane receptor for ferrienterochelin and colicin
VNPTWRHNLRVNWQTPWKVLLSAQWRFIDGTDFDNNSNDPSLHFHEEGGYDALNARIASYSYLDLSAEWKVYKDIELRAGVDNVLDKDPPFVPDTDISGNSGVSNSYTTYDLLGRQIFVAIKAKF